jgi:hypothetical protein
MKLLSYHKLSGVDIEGKVLRFIFDGKVLEYTMVKDEKGNTSMKGPEYSDTKVKNTFEEVTVKVREYYDANKFIGLEMFDDNTKLEVLTVGTSYDTRSQPSAVLEWYPQNLSINFDKELKKDPLKRKPYKTGHNRKKSPKIK